MGFFQVTHSETSEFARRYTVEHFRVGTPVVSLHRLDYGRTPYDRVRGDIVGEKVYFDPVEVHCYIDPQVESLSYDEFGLNESRGLEAFFSVDDLVSLEVEVSPGDYIEYDGRGYDVKTVQGEGWYLGDSRPYLLKAWLNIKRGNTLSEGYARRVASDRGISEDEFVEMSAPVVVSENEERVGSRADEGDLVLY